DADPMTVVPWPLPLIRDFMMPNEPLWDEVLRKCIGFTFAREPFHSGGLVASNALFADAAQVIFCELFGASLP
ncbi:MAG: hypothetical protein ACJ790_10155, partial [Myxococcaceae bacterium]